MYDFFEPKTIQVEYFLEKGTDKIRGDILERIKTPVTINADILRKYRGKQHSPSSWWESFCFLTDQFYEYSCTFISEFSESDYTTILPLDWVEIFQHVDYNGPDSIPKKLRQKFKEFVPQTSVRFEKWNPSDVYVVSNYHSYLILDEIDRCKSLSEIDTLLEKFFGEKILRGISLKKTKKEFLPDLVINKKTSAPNFKINSFRDSTNPLDTISLGIICDVVGSETFKNRLDLRSFGGQSIENISGEVSQFPSKGSKHGKISLTGINNILESYLKDLELKHYKVPTTRELKNLTDEQLISDILLGHKEIFGKTNTNLPHRITRSRLVSKYQAIYFGKIINDIINKNLFYQNTSQKLEDVIMTEILHYALSIRNIYFDSSVYVRIL